MEINQLVKKGKVNALNNFSIDPNSLARNSVYIKSNYRKMQVREYILKKTKCDEEKLISSLKLVNLSSEILDEDLKLLSFTEYLKIELAVALILNLKTIILYQFDKYFMEKDLAFFKRLLKKLTVKYNKTIVLIDSDFSFMLDFVDRLVLLADNSIVKVYDKDEFYNNDLEEYIKIPNIIDFVKHVNRDRKILNNYTDIKELIKAIFREV